LPYHPAIPLLEIYLKECESSYYKGTCTPMFVARLFTVAKLWKQLRTLLLTNRLSKYCIYIMEFYWATMKNEIFSFADKWIEMDDIILSEVSQTQKTKSLMSSLRCGI
jgi:hypothetical protein